jgi:hypothetical protein
MSITLPPCIEDRFRISVDHDAATHQILRRFENEPLRGGLRARQDLP